MSAKTPTEAEITALKDLLNCIPDNFKGVHGGFMSSYGEELKTMPYAKDLKNMFTVLDYFCGVMRDTLECQMTANLWEIDRILLEHDLTHSDYAPSNLLKELEQYTNFMRPTERSIRSLRYRILDLICYIYSINGFLAGIRALKKVTGATKGGRYLEDQLRLKKTALNWKTTPLQGLKDACRKSEAYHFEDYLSCLNAGLLELKKRGIDLDIPPVEFSRLRPTPSTIQAIISSGHFLATNMYLVENIGPMAISMYQIHEEYVKQVGPYYALYERKLFEIERELYPRAYMTNN